LCLIYCYAECQYVECRYAGRRHAECRSASMNRQENTKTKN
jgi:hypothetical protein